MAEAGGSFSDEVPSPSDDGQELCRYFNTEGGCRYGDRCRYKHVMGVKPECWFYRSRGWCGFGDKCYFDHAPFEGKESILEGTASCGKAGTVEEASVDQDDETSVSILTSARDWIKSLGSKAGKSRSADKVKKIEMDSLKSVDGPVCDDDNNNKPAKIGQREAVNADQAEGGKMKSEAQGESVKCGECNTIFHEDSLSASKKALADHYQVKLSKTDRRHLGVFRQNSDMFEIIYTCKLCDRILSNIVGFLQHTTGKATSAKAEGKAHQEVLDKMIGLYVDRDVGTIDEEEMLAQLLEMLETDDSDWECESDSDDSHHQLPYFARAIQRLIMKGANDDSDDDELEERSENFGFTCDEVNELLCQGIKPWDPEAYDALDVLYDY